MARGGVGIGAMAHVARGNQSAARDCLRDFAHHHAIHADQLAGLQVRERKLLLGGNVFGHGTRIGSGRVPVMHKRSGGEGCERHQDVIAGINLQGGFRHGECSFDNHNTTTSQGYNPAHARQPPPIVYDRCVARVPPKGEKMKAVMLEGPGQAQLASVAEPRITSEDEILLEVRRIGLCGHGSEFLSRAESADFVSAHPRT